MNTSNKVSCIGNGYVGKSMLKLFPDAYIYDEPLGIGTKEEVNKTKVAIIAVPTNLLPDGGLDMSIVEDVVSWLETPLIIIKSALMPGTVDRLVAKYNKHIVVSVEMVGEGKYFIPYWKYPDPTDERLHGFLIMGGVEKDATKAAEYFWEKMSPDIDIHIVSAVEAEICKLMENTFGALKVTFANTIYDICEAYGANYIKVMQAWGAQGTWVGNEGTGKMHMRVVPGKRGWKSKCWDKDPSALAKSAKDIGVDDLYDLINTMIRINKNHFKKNEKN